MRAKVELHRHPAYVRHEPPSFTYEITNLNFQNRSRDGQAIYCLRDRMIDEQGRYATDFEHDGASKFMIEVYAFGTSLITEGWTEIMGFVTELRVYDDGVDPWEGATECTNEHCLASGGHKFVEYLPPRDDEERERSGGRMATFSGDTSKWFGRIARVTILEDEK